MGRKKKVKPDDVVTLPEEMTVELGTKIDLSKEYSAPPEPKEPETVNPFADLTQGDTEKTEPGKRKYTKRSKDEEPLIDGEMLLMFCDVLIPNIIAFSSNSLTGSKVNADDIMLSPRQEAKLKKLADKVAEKLDIDVNPIAGFFVVMAGMYGFNYMAAKKDDK